MMTDGGGMPGVGMATTANGGVAGGMGNGNGGGIGVGGGAGISGGSLSSSAIVTSIQISKADHECNPYLEELSGQSRDISSQAVWTLSSCKSGYGVEHLIDNCLDTFWQSDGPQPHLVNMQFKQKTKVKDLCIYADYKQDESYTPSRIVIKVGFFFS